MHCGPDMRCPALRRTQVTPGSFPTAALRPLQVRARCLSAHAARATRSCRNIRLLRGACHWTGHVVRGPADGSVSALYFVAASDAFANDLDGRPMANITYKTPADSAGALRITRCALQVSRSVTLIAPASLQLRCCVGVEALRSLDPDLDPSAAPEWAHRIDGTQSGLV